MSTATQRITKPRALAMRTILELFHSLRIAAARRWPMLSSPGLRTAATRLQDTDKLALIGSYNRVKWTAAAAAGGGRGRLHGEDAAARSALIPLPAQPPRLLLLTLLQAAALIKKMEQKCASSQLKDKPPPSPPPHAHVHASIHATVCTMDSLSGNTLN